MDDKTYYEEMNTELRKENTRLHKELDDIQTRWIHDTRKLDPLEEENRDLRESLSRIQKDLLLYIQLNGELARENQILHEKLKEYQSEDKS